MNVAIGQYIEALNSGEERFRTLARIILLGGPTVAGNGLVDFDLTVDGEAMTLRCPLRVDGASRKAFAQLAGRDEGLGGRFYEEWRRLEDEILLYDIAERPFTADVLIRPSQRGESLVDYLARLDARGDRDARREAAERCEELLRWAELHQRGVALHRLMVTARGELRVTAFSAVGEAERIRALLGKSAPAAEQSAPRFDSAWDDVMWDSYWGVAVAVSGGKWTMLDGGGKVLTDRLYDWMSEVSEGLVLAVRSGKCGFVDASGREAIPCEWDEAGSFMGGVALVTHAGETFLVDARGRRIGK